jgi:hypothetical protein
MRTWSKKDFRISTDLTFANSAARSIFWSQGIKQADQTDVTWSAIRPSRAGGYPTPWALQRSCSDAGCSWILRSDSDPARIPVPLVPSCSIWPHKTPDQQQTMFDYAKGCSWTNQKVEMCWNHLKSLNFCWFPQRNKHQLLVQLWVELLPVEVGPLRQRRLVVLVVLVVAADGAVVGRVSHLLEEETHLAVRYHGWPDDIPVQTPK